MSIADKITRLTTARGNIRAALAAKGATATDHGFEDFSTDIGNIQTGITPSGTLNITADGTYNVTNYASAVVDVDPTNIKQWTYTSTGTASTAYTTLISGDAWLASNRSNSNLVVCIRPKFVPQLGTSVRSLVFAMGSNMPIGYGYREIGGSLGNVYGVFARYGTDAGAIYAYTRNYGLTEANDLGDIGITSSGGLIFYAYTGSTYMLQTGDWDITAYIAG